jgi:YD repeat-containing protein
MPTTVSAFTYKERIAYNASNQPIYQGWASPGAATSDAVWRICKMTWDASGNMTSIDWCDSNKNFDNIWDDRASVTYTYG